MENFGELITKYWGFVLFLLGLCFHAIWTYFRVGEHDQKIKSLEDKTDTHSTTVNQINSRLDSMEAKLDILLEGFNTKKK